MLIKIGKKLILLSMLASLFFGFNGAHAEEVKKAHNIVFQVLDDDPVKWVQVLGITRNVQQLMGKDNVAIEVVVHSGGIYMLKQGAAVANRVAAAQKEGIVFAACAQSMKRDSLSEKDLHEGVQIVSIGAVEIMKKVEAGWTYIRL